MIIHDCEQNSDEWHALRLGIPTASAFDRILTPKGKLSTQAEKYKNWLLAEWIIGQPLENFSSQFMQRGHDMEPAAAESYEFETGRTVKTVGFITTDDGMIGCSPDRLVGDDGLLEIKSTSPQVHVGYMRMRDIDEEYKVQVQGQLWVAEREWDDVQSYCPPLPAAIVRATRDEKFIAVLASSVRQFVDQMLAARADLEQRYGKLQRVITSEPTGDFDVTDDDVDEMIRHGIMVPK